MNSQTRSFLTFAIAALAISMGHLALNSGFSLLFAATAILVRHKMAPGYFYLVTSNVKLLFLALTVFLYFNKQFALNEVHVAHLMIAYLIWVVAEIFFYFKLLKNRPLKP